MDLDIIKIIDWYFPLNDEDFMGITISLNGYLFNGTIEAVKNDK